MTGHHDERTLDDTDANTPGAAGLLPGAVVGRYIIAERLGAGGMGVVYAARDPELERDVAIKLLHRPEGSAGSQPSDGRLRLAREAQAMARLTHRNVVTVHDVGEHDGQVFIAMERVAGVTLSRWLGLRSGDAPRPLGQILDVFTRAGHGLAAAHAAGLVHQDFKPDNVMVCTDAHGAIERVLVMDFGLARSTGQQVIEPDVQAVTEELNSIDGATLTGGVRGTPAYMSPEQHLGADVGPASDQFSFCVALFEAVVGQRPFRGDNAVALAFAVIEGDLTPPPADVDAPAWLITVLRRGLAARAADRWPSMPGLLRQLRRERRRGAGRWVFALLAGGVAVAAWAGASSGPEPCESVADEIADVWSSDDRSVAQTRFSEADALPAEAWTEVSGAMDSYAQTWAVARVEACREAPDGDEDLRARRRACLEGRRRHFAAVAAVLTDPGLALGADPGEAVAGLPPLAPCADPALLRAQVQPPRDEAVRRDVEALRTELSRIEVLQDAGRLTEALAAAEPALLRARALGYAPATAEAARSLGVAHLELGRTAEALPLLEEAYLAASGAGHERVAAEAAIDLAYGYGVDERRPDQAKTWVEHARAHVARTGETQTLPRALQMTEATVAWAEGRYEDAVTAATAGLEMAEDEARATGNLRPVARLLQNLGLYETKAGRAAQGVAHFERALAVIEDRLGPDHVLAGQILGNMGIALSQDDQPDRALAAYDRALKIRERVLGPDAAEVGTLVQNIAIVHAERGRNEQALPMFERALQIRKATLAPDHPQIGAGHMNLAISLGLAGRRSEAIEHLSVALDITQTAAGPDGATKDPAIGMIHFELGNQHRELSQLDLALSHHQRALSILGAALGTEHPNMVVARATLAETLEARGDNERALAEYTTALALGESVGLRESELALVRIGTASLLWALRPQQRDEAVAMVRRSVAAVPEGDANRSEAEAWLAERTAQPDGAP